MPYSNPENDPRNLNNLRPCKSVPTVEDPPSFQEYARRGLYPLAGLVEVMPRIELNSENVLDRCGALRLPHPTRARNDTLGGVA